MDSPQRVATKPVKRDGDSESGSPHSATFARIAALKQSGFGFRVYKGSFKKVYRGSLKKIYKGSIKGFRVEGLGA